jgi:tetratricopeptide (TPR) repeat protein
VSPPGALHKLTTGHGPVDFFISYNRADLAWAVWVAWQLENGGYKTIVQEWDFRPGNNFVRNMEWAATQAERTIALLSRTYLDSRFTSSEWCAAFARDPDGRQGYLIPVRIGECEPLGLLPQIIFIDLVGLDKESARIRLLDGVRRGRAKPEVEPEFPGSPAADGNSTAHNRSTVPGTMRDLTHSYRDNLPRKQWLIGRWDTVSELLEILSPESPEYLVSIDGFAGIGKSALALEVAHSSLRKSLFTAVIWVSAKESTLTGLGVRREVQRISALQDILLTIAEVLEYRGFGALDPMGQRQVIKRLLAAQTTLLILDNIDSLKEPEIEQILEFMQEMPPTVKGLITSRIPLPDIHRIELKELAPDDAERLLTYYAARAAMTLTSRDSRILLEAAGGHPLALRWLQGQMSQSGMPAARIVQGLLHDSTLPLTEYCLGGSWRLLESSIARRILIAIAAHSEAVSFDALVAVAGSEADEVVSSELAKLQRLSLVVRDPDVQRFDLLPLTRSFVRKQSAIEAPELMDQIVDSTISYYLKQVLMVVPYSSGNACDSLLKDRGNILTFLRLAYERAQSSAPNEIAERFIHFAEQFGKILWQWGFWQDRIEVGRAGVEICKRFGDQRHQAIFLRNLAWVYYHQGDYEQSFEVATQSLIAARGIMDRHLVLASLRTLGVIEIRQNNFLAAERLLLEAITESLALRKTCEDDYLLYALGFTYYDLGELYLELRKFEAAEKAYTSSLEIWKTPGRVEPERHTPYPLVGLGFVALRTGLLEKARGILAEALRLTDGRGRVDVVARAKLGLAEVDLAVENWARGLAVAGEALELFRRQGMWHEIRLVEALLRKHENRLAAAHANA